MSAPASHAQTCESRVREVITRDNLARETAWLRLLQYRRTSLVFASEADGKHFFIAPNGNRHPDRELDAFVTELCAGRPRVTGMSVGDMPARCQFPARERWLAGRVGAAPWPQPACPKLEEWRERQQARSATLVFSSYYPNNPSSVFGHTLLRLNRKPEGAAQESPLLSRGINFAANATTSNALFYALMGLTGGFKGTFTAMPYFYKVREYGDFESRDIWEYDLSLKPAQVENLVDVIWELGFTDFNYYYFTENCSYHLLTALEAAAPELHLSERLPWWVIPVDTVREVVASPGLVERVVFRPSLFRQFQTRYEALPDAQMRAAFARTVFARELPTGLAPLQRAQVLDAALDYWDFRHARALTAQEPEPSAFKQKLLVARAAEPSLPPLAIPVPEDARPDRGHASMRYGLGTGYDRRDGIFGDVDVRFALHDLLDPAPGYPATSAIEFFGVGLRVNDERARVESLRVVDVLLAAPVTRLRVPLSWRFNVGAERVRGDECDRCLAAGVLLQGGLSASFAGERALLYGLGGGVARYSGELRPARVGLAPRLNLGLRWRFTDRFAQLLEYEGEQALGPRGRWLTKGTLGVRYAPSLNWAVDLTLKQYESAENEAGLRVYLYR